MEPEQGTVLRLHGELDDEACARVRRELAPQLAAGLRHVLLDLSHVTDLSPQAVEMLRSMDQHLRRQQGGLLLVHASGPVRRTLRINDLEQLLQVRDLEPPVARPVRTPRPKPDVAGVIPLRARVARK